MANMARRVKELMSKYGKVAVGVHLSVSAVSTASIYCAIQNNLDVEALLERVGLYRGDKAADVASIEKTIEAVEAPIEQITGLHFPREHQRSPETGDTLPKMQNEGNSSESTRAPGDSSWSFSGGGALALAILCNKALFPVRAPLTLAITPPVWRFLVSRGLRV